MYKNETAAQIAEVLCFTNAERISTGNMSMLEEATIEFGYRFKNVHLAHVLFSQARRSYHDSYSTATREYSPHAAKVLAAAAHWLGEELRPLGDMKILRCERQTGWGTCTLPLESDGVCDYEGHID